MNDRDYGEYLKSSRWRELSAETIKARGKCESCSETSRLQCHHRDRSRLGGETSNDLVVLCKQCHEDVEGFYKPFKAFRSLPEATDIFLRGFPKIPVSLPVVGFFETGVKRPNLWYRHNEKFSGSINADLFLKTKALFPSAVAISKEDWRSWRGMHIFPPTVEGVIYRVCIFAKAKEGNGFRYVDFKGLTGYVFPDPGTTLLANISDLPVFSRDEGKVVGKILHQRMESSMELTLF